MIIRKPFTGSRLWMAGALLILLSLQFIPFEGFSQANTDSSSRSPFSRLINNPQLMDSLRSDTVIKTTGAVPVNIERRAQRAAKDTAAADTLPKTTERKRHSPLKAALFSLAVPGLGQAYNKKYWKIPIVYAGFGGLSYAVYHTATNFHGYRRAYRAHVAIPPDLTASHKGVNNTEALKSYRDYYKRYLDISIICFSLWHVLNIVDATVDAHLFEWNMKDDLSVSWQPALIAPPTHQSSAATGVKIQLNF